MELRKIQVVLASMALVSLSACNPFGGGQEQQQADAQDQKLALAGGQAGAPGTAAPDFGDDSSQFSKDGECDDKRFEGPGMTNTPLLDQDVGHDASDCRSAFEQNRLTVRSNTPTAQVAGKSSAEVSHIQWGDDNGNFANDGECDDKRFAGAGMTSTPLLDQDVQHDATDCRTAFEQGRLQLR